MVLTFTKMPVYAFKHYHSESKKQEELKNN